MTAGGASPAAEEAPAWLARVLRAGQADELRGTWQARTKVGARDSAVLMLFGPSAEGGEDVVLTERAATLRKHAGQVSFPGGAVDPGDDHLTATALREASEEIGLAPDGVDVLGELAPIALNVSNFVVNPVLAWWRVPSSVSALDPREVERVARVRVADLVAPENRFTVVHPRGYEGPAFEVDGFYVWGFTAFLLDAVLRSGGVAREWDVDDRRQLPERFLR